MLYPASPSSANGARPDAPDRPADMAFELDAKALRYFTAVAERGSFSQAAAHLRITQPAVSRQIQAIERAYETRLFRREGRQMVLTEAGQVLFERAKDIVGQLDDVHALVTAASRRPTGRISVGVTTSAAEILMPEIVGRYRASYPEVFIHIVQGSSSELKEMLAHGKLDMALIYGQPGSHNPALRPLVDLKIGLVAPPAHVLGEHDPVAGLREIAIEQAVKLPLIFPGKQESLRAAIEQACQRVGVVPNVIVESESLLLSKALVRAGTGFMLIGYVGVQAEVEQGLLRFVPLSPPGVTWRMSLAVNGSKSSSLAVRVMATEIQDAVVRGVLGKLWHGELLEGKA